MTEATVTPGPDETLRAEMDRMLHDAGITANRELIRRIIGTAIELGRDGTERLDLKITASAVAEMRRAFRIFAPYAGVPKVTIFGSARTRSDDPLYGQAHDIAERLAERGWMVVTGAGPGIMQAAAEGAGPDRAIGVSIRLPFEERPNAIFADRDNVVAMKYFFTRKLMLMKESSGFVCVPGGFGTMDEMFELLTLQQTGKAEPMPIVLLDEPGGQFWSGLRRFVDEQMIPAGVVSGDDLERVLITDSVAEAEAEITGFWRNYDSLRWIDELLVLRIRATPTPQELESLNERFGHLLVSGRIESMSALPVEIADQDVPELPRLTMILNPFKVGHLFHLIRAINELDSAPERVPAGTKNPSE
ncbi:MULTISPECIES: TIGR00730 family Rossman fold protein [Microbacterium]|jgi:uncharacterized protein (TIGR00730 family)|uniref:LOG family protein n=1 Tax=Microbacterium TaxID=33882 RepID=UPI001E3391D6|nr:TIGR00730 family Rossman fold protein [Microbacterium nymphoidis]MCD2496769.1 TIGR00730 family Rossman fold protein [Microbacterium nymphoidis]